MKGRITVGPAPIPKWKKGPNGKGNRGEDVTHAIGVDRAQAQDPNRKSGQGGKHASASEALAAGGLGGLHEHIRNNDPFLQSKRQASHCCHAINFRETHFGAQLVACVCVCV